MTPLLRDLRDQYATAMLDENERRLKERQRWEAEGEIFAEPFRPNISSPATLRQAVGHLQRHIGAVETLQVSSGLACGFPPSDASLRFWSARCSARAIQEAALAHQGRGPALSHPRTHTASSAVHPDRGEDARARRAAITPHDLKRTAISWMAQDGVCYQLIAEYTETSVTTIVAHYGHLHPNAYQAIHSATKLNLPGRRFTAVDGEGW